MSFTHMLGMVAFVFGLSLCTNGFIMMDPPPDPLVMLAVGMAAMVVGAFALSKN